MTVTRAICIGLPVCMLVSCISPRSDASLTATTTSALGDATPAEMPIPKPTTSPAPPLVIADGSSLGEALFVVLSSDHTQLLAAYAGESRLRVLHQFGPPPERAQVIFHPAGFPVLSSDGTWVTVVENEAFDLSSIYRISLVGSDEDIPLLNWRGPQFEATISPDGRRIAFLSAEGECPERVGYAQRVWCRNLHVYVMDSDGNNVKRLTDAAADRCFLTWSPNSTQVVYREGCDSPQIRPPQLYVVTLEPYNNPSHVTQISASGVIGPYSESTWSPDGEWLQWSTTGGATAGEYRLSRLDAEGRVVEEILSSLSAFGIWSPDSTHLASFSDLAITIWDIESGQIQTYGLRGVLPLLPQAWLPDGERFVFAGQRSVHDDLQWFLVNTDGTELIAFEAP